MRIVLEDGLSRFCTEYLQARHTDIEISVRVKPCEIGRHTIAEHIETSISIQPEIQLAVSMIEGLSQPMEIIDDDVSFPTSVYCTASK